MRSFDFTPGRLSRRLSLYMSMSSMQDIWVEVKTQRAGKPASGTIGALV